jgi:hypothetical protein
MSAAIVYFAGQVLRAESTPVRRHHLGAPTFSPAPPQGDMSKAFVKKPGQFSTTSHHHHRVRADPQPKSATSLPPRPAHDGCAGHSTTSDWVHHGVRRSSLRPFGRRGTLWPALATACRPRWIPLTLLATTLRDSVKRSTSQHFRDNIPTSITHAPIPSISRLFIASFRNATPWRHCRPAEHHALRTSRVPASYSFTTTPPSSLFKTVNERRRRMALCRDELVHPTKAGYSSRCCSSRLSRPPFLSNTDPIFTPISSLCDDSL